MRYTKYKEVVEELLDAGLSDEDFIYSSLTVSHLQRVGKIHGDIPFIALKRTSPIRKKMFDYIFLTLSQGKKITHAGIQAASGTNKHEWTDKDFEEHYTPHAAANAIRYRAGVYNLPNTAPRSPLTQRGHEIICDTVFRKILLRVISAGYGDTEYSALSHVMKWAAERLESEELAKENQS
ncbi:MAG: hypothetical protein WC998_08030 [Candidatus Paceibacterota bacterium]|jgi:hypothetical protein